MPPPALGRASEQQGMLILGVKIYEGKECFQGNLKAVLQARARPP